MRKTVPSLRRSAAVRLMNPIPYSAEAPAISPSAFSERRAMSLIAFSKRSFSEVCSAWVSAATFSEARAASAASVSSSVLVLTSLRRSSFADSRRAISEEVVSRRSVSWVRRSRISPSLVSSISDLAVRSAAT